jgi:hypothetical protein
MPELTFENYLRVSEILNQHIGRNNYTISATDNEDLKYDLIERNKELEEANDLVKSAYWGEWILENNDAQVA